MVLSITMVLVYSVLIFAVYKRLRKNKIGARSSNAVVQRSRDQVLTESCQIIHEFQFKVTKTLTLSIEREK